MTEPKPRHFEGVKFEGNGYKPDHDPTVTAPVTQPRKEPTPWERVNMTKEDWDACAIPDYLSRSSPSTTQPSAPPPSRATSPTPKPATAPAATPSAGTKSGSGSKSTTTSSTSKLSDFESFRVDPNLIETKIRQEADRRWREWTPTVTDARKGVQTRPRLSTFLKQVRKEYY